VGAESNNGRDIDHEYNGGVRITGPVSVREEFNISEGNPDMRVLTSSSFLYFTLQKMVGIQYSEIGILICGFPHVFYLASVGAGLFSSGGRLLGFLHIVNQE